MDAGEGSRTEIIRAVRFPHISIAIEAVESIQTSLIVLSIPVGIARNVLGLLLLLSAATKHLLEELKLDRGSEEEAHKEQENLSE
jgi:hypothetical protein